MTRTRLFLSSFSSVICCLYASFHIIDEILQRNGAHLFAHDILYGNQALIQDGMHVFADRTLRIGMFVKMKQILFFFYRFKDVQQRDLLWIVRQGGAAFSGSDMNDAGSFQLSQRIADDDRMDIDALCQKGGRCLFFVGKFSDC